MSISAYGEREKRDDYRAGVVGAILINVNRDPKKSRRVKPEDLFPVLKPPKRVQTAEQMQKMFLMLAHTSSGQVVRKPGWEVEAMANGG